MMMYYDARPCEWNGLFDFYTLEPIKGYYAFYTFANLYELGTQTEATTDDSDIYVIAACGCDKYAAAVTYYTENDNLSAKDVTISIGKAIPQGIKLYLTDENNTYTPYTSYKSDKDKITLRLKRNSILYIEF